MDTEQLIRWHLLWEVGVLKQKCPPWEGYGYFLEQTADAGGGKISLVEMTPEMAKWLLKTRA